MVAIALCCVTSALFAQAPGQSSGITPWQIGDIFVGVGNPLSSAGIYKTLDGSGHPKLDGSGQVVPDLNTSTTWTTNCMVDRAVPNGDLWTASWEDMALSHFSGIDHSLVASYAFDNPTDIPITQPDGSIVFESYPLPTGLAAVPRAAGVPALPDDAIGVPAAIGPVAPAIDSGVRSIVIAPMPAIQAVNSLIFSTSGPYAGQMYVGTATPPDNSVGRGYAYLLRFAYDPNAGVTPDNPTGSKLTLTGWWVLDAGAIPSRQAERDALIAAGDPTDAANRVDGSSDGAGGIDNIDLGSDQQTIFYTSEDPYIRTFNVVTGVQGPKIALSRLAPDPVTGELTWQTIPDARALVIRALPGKVDATGTLNPTAAGDGSAGFIVGDVGGVVYRVDKDGHVMYVYNAAGGVSSINLAPDGQYFWAATPQDPYNPQPLGGLLYRFHIASGVASGPFSPYGQSDPAVRVISGVCVQYEYYAGITSVDNQKACTAMNADGSPQLDSSGEPVADYCRTPTLCSATARGVALSPSGVPLGPNDPANADCYPPGSHKPTFAGQHNREGDAVSIDLRTGNPDLVIDGVVGQPIGLQFANGVLSGTISTADCNITNGTCSDQVTVYAHFAQDVNANGQVTLGSNGLFTWFVDDGNARPTIALAPGATTVETVLTPMTIPLSIFDQDADDVELLRMSGAPAGVTVTDRTGSAVGFNAAISGTPQAAPPYPHAFPITIDLFDCTPGWADANGATATLIDLQNAIAAGQCFHHVQLAFPLTITNLPPVFTAPIANQLSSVGSPIAPVTVSASDPDQQLPIRFTVTGLPAGLDYCHLDPATGACPASPAAWHTPIATNQNPAAQTIRIFGTPTTAVNNAPVVVTIDDLGLGERTTTFTWTVTTNRPPVCTGASASPALLWPPNHQLVPFSVLGVTDPDKDPVTITITRITQDQPSNGTGDGNTPIDATGVGTGAGAVRAERTGNLRVPDDGRLYQIDFTASDGKGGTCAGTVFVGVPHDQGQHTLPSDNQCRWDSTTGAQLGPCAWLHAPVLTLAKRTNLEGDAVRVQIVAVDPDGTPLIYSATGLPPGLSMSSSGTISGTVAAGAAGGKKGTRVYAVSVSVSDGFGGDTKTFSWTVTGS